MPEVILNCSSFESTLNSLALALRVNPEDILSHIEKIDKMLYPSVEHEWDFDELFFPEFMKDFEPVPFSTVYWFHLTNTFPDNLFIAGLLPRSQIEPKIWQRIIFEIRKTDKDVSMNLQDCIHTYINQYTEGPCAMLVRQHAFHPKEIGSNNDYLSEPEFIQDACHKYMSKFQTDIKPLILRLLVPCIITFKGFQKNLDNDDYLLSALKYIYYSRKRCFPNLYCFNGEGQRVPPEQIIHIDFNPIEY